MLPVMDAKGTVLAVLSIMGNRMHRCVRPVGPGADVGWGEPSPGADVNEGEPGPGADVAGVSPVPAQM